MKRLLLRVIVHMLAICLVTCANNRNSSVKINSSDVNEQYNDNNTTTKTMEDKNNISQNMMTTTTASSIHSTTTSAKFKHIRFQDNWGVEYPTCSSSNKFLSPVNINTNKVIEVGKYVRTLQLYAYEPIESYFLQTWYNDTENNITMSALTITLDDGVFFEAAYINGLGYAEFQIFQRAVFFFSKTKLRHGQSSHQINGKSYPMEIMLTFTNRKPDNETIKNSTQLFILIDIQSYDNPNFFPVIQAAKEILEMKSKSEILKNLIQTLDQLTQMLTNVTQHYKKNGGQDETKLQPLIDKIKKSVTKVARNQKQMIGLSYLVNATKKQLKMGYELKYDRMSRLYENEVQNDTILKKEIESKGSQWEFLQQKSDIDESLLRKSNLRNSYGIILGSLFNEIAYFNKILANLESEDTEYNRFIQNATNQIQGDEKPTNGTFLITFFQNQIKLFQEIHDIQKKINSTKSEIEKRKKSLGWKKRLETFQITWLLPDHGGLYVYNGSNPLPPCQQVHYSVVLKDPVGISKKQYDTLASIPAYEGYQPVTEEVVPPFAELGSRTVWHNAKNIQWQRDDGVHMKSIIRRQWKLDIQKERMEAAGSSGQSSLEPILILIILYLLFLNCFQNRLEE